MHSVLSYFRNYFDPQGAAPLANHSAGQIARHLHETLGRYGTVDYLDYAEAPRGMQADLFVGHFWAFDGAWRQNVFRKKVAFYTASDPEARRAFLKPLAQEFGVPFPEWDFPPESFDHRATMDAADLVLLVGNRWTLDSFAERWRQKIRCLNYSVDTALYGAPSDVPRMNEFCYVATECGLRKGFMDVLRTWSGISPRETRLHAVGKLGQGWERHLQLHNHGNIVFHNWIDSHSEEYIRLLKSCRFAFIPTYAEGQMGTLLEAIFCGCVPITTRQSGIDERVLEHCIVVEPLQIDQQRAAIRDVLAWSAPEFAARQARVMEAAQACQTWDVFARGVANGLAELGFLLPAGSRP
jgi:glycosyltransferase involved in cell wall biosynthesis